MTRGQGFTVDVGCRLVRAADGRPLHLTRKAFDLLQLLLEAAPRVMTKRELHERMWPTTFVSDAALTALVKELRRVLPDRDGVGPIRTVHGVGYAFDTGDSPVPATAHVLLATDRRFLLEDGDHLVGRDASARIHLDRSDVSRRHALVRVRGATVTIEDLGSKNGTEVNGVKAQADVPLADGDRLRIGGETVTYLARADAGSTVTRSGRA